MLMICDSEGDNAALVGGQGAVTEDRSKSGDAASVSSTSKIDPQAPVWTKKVIISCVKLHLPL